MSEIAWFIEHADTWREWVVLASAAGILVGILGILVTATLVSLGWP